MSSAARHPRREAAEVAGPEFDVRVLEPSPPAVNDGEWFADDPVSGGQPAGKPVLGPVEGADLSWDDWARDHPDRAGWVGDRWLGAYRRLGPLPGKLGETRLALHRAAVYAISPARRRATGKIALRWTLGGFGTPFFGEDEQLRVVGTDLVRQRGDVAESQPITSLAEAAGFAIDDRPDIEWGRNFDVPEPGDPGEELVVDPTAAGFLADWYGFAWSVLEEVRADTRSTDPSRVQLWPEHFDAAFDCLAADRRATLGASPGDAAVPGPYLYVISPVIAADGGNRGPAWNARSFAGAILTFDELEPVADQRATAVEFFRSRRDLLALT